MKMIRYTFYLLALTITACSGNQTNCDQPENFAKLDWKPLEENVRYWSCGETSSSQPDSFTVSFLGRLKEDETLQSLELDSMAFALLYDLPIGTFPFSDSAKFKAIAPVFSKMKKANYFIRLDNVELQPGSSPTALSIYFTDDGDSAAINRWAAQLISSGVATRFTYFSKEEAKKKFLEEGNADYNEVLDYNPLPASGELTLSSKYGNPKSIDSLKATWSSNPILLDVQYPTMSNPETVRRLEEFSNSSFIIRIQSR